MAHHTAIILFFFFFLLSLFSSSSAAACQEVDKKALTAFKNSFHFTSLGKWWSDSTDCCRWSSVRCDSATGRVTSLDFTNDYDFPESIFLNGSIPSSIGDLTELDRLVFSGISSLTGPIPPQLAKLKKLRSLTVYKTSVSGPIPSFLSQLPSLEHLSLQYNQLSGTIPPSLGNLGTLADISFSGNRLTGPIPATLFSKLRRGSLATLVLASNKLTGVVPRSFGGVSFSSISLDDNLLTGDASFLFGRSKPATFISLAKNRLSFDLGKVVYPVKNLNYVDVSHNNIYGAISEQVKEVSNLVHFDVSYNQLCGKIPSLVVVALSAESYSHNKCLCGAPLLPCK